MMKRFLFIFLLLPAAFCLAENDTVPLTLEYARTPNEIEWGLMQRAKLPENHGMLFIYPAPRKVNFWMFNCLIDLSVAYLDQQGLVREIHPLKAYPQMMDPARPVASLQEIRRYPARDPILAFFRKNSVRSSFKISYALEMNQGWFERNNIGEGDTLHFRIPSPQAYFVRGQKGKS